MKSIFAAAVIILCASFSHASSYVSCGTGAHDEEGSYGANQELQIASGDDVYDGVVDGSWGLKLKNAADWMTADKDVSAATTKNSEGQTVVTVTIINAENAIGLIGFKYVLTDLYSEQPTLEKFAVGGFAGGTRTGQFTCVSAND